jgi:hypothetical protein
MNTVYGGIGNKCDVALKDDYLKTSPKEYKKFTFKTTQKSMLWEGGGGYKKRTHFSFLGRSNKAD